MYKAVFILALTFAFAIAPEARAHGSACGEACVDLDADGMENDLVACAETAPEGLPACGCTSVHEPNALHNVASISGYADADGTVEGCVDVFGQAGVDHHTQHSLSTDVGHCRVNAGKACFEHGCYEVVQKDVAMQECPGHDGGSH